jgi:hypothetical protein
MTKEIISMIRIEGWLEDQPEQLDFGNFLQPNFKQRVMSDSPIQPWAAGPFERPGLPSKRQLSICSVLLL